jgi:hypothetical protein
VVIHFVELCSNNLSECVGADRGGGLSGKRHKQTEIAAAEKGGNYNRLDSILAKKYLASD